MLLRGCGEDACYLYLISELQSLKLVHFINIGKWLPEKYFVSAVVILVETFIMARRYHPMSQLRIAPRQWHASQTSQVGLSISAQIVLITLSALMFINSFLSLGRRVLQTKHGRCSQSRQLEVETPYRPWRPPEMPDRGPPCALGLQRPECSENYTSKLSGTIFY